MIGTKYLTIPETAEKLGVSRKTVYRFIKRGDLEAIEVPPGGDLRVSTTEVRRFTEWCHNGNTRSKLIRCPKCGWKF